jgi:hypothetical protein
MSNTVGVIFAAVTFGGTGEGKLMANDLLEVSARCESAATCAFDGRAIKLAVTITNTSERSVEVPLQFVTRIGPYLEILDRTTDRSRKLRAGFAGPNLIDKWSLLLPGQSFSLSAVIAPSEIRPFFEARYHDVEVKVTVPVRVRVGNAEIIDFRTPYFLKIFRAEGSRLDSPSTEKNYKQLSEQEFKDLMDKLQ